MRSSSVPCCKHIDVILRTCKQPVSRLAASENCVYILLGRTPLSMSKHNSRLVKVQQLKAHYKFNKNKSMTSS